MHIWPGAQLARTALTALSGAAGPSGATSLNLAGTLEA